MAKKISTVLASERSYKVRPFALLDHTHAFYPGAVADIAARDAITGDQRYDGSIVYVESDQTTYQLRGGSSNADWVTLVTVTGVASHTELGDIGTNTHAQIDSHIADATLHFTQAAISITESQISDLQAYVTIAHNHDAAYLGITAVATSTNALESATSTINVSAATAPTVGQVLTATAHDNATWQDPVGGGGGGVTNPAAPANSLQFNAAGIFGGSAELTYDLTTLLIGDDGSALTADSLLAVMADDSIPWAFTLGNATYSAVLAEGFRIQIQDGGNVEIHAPDDGVTPGDMLLYTDGLLAVTIAGADQDIAFAGYINGYAGTPTDGQFLTWVTSNGRAEFTTPAVTLATGTPIDNQIAVFDSATSIEGHTEFLWDQVLFTAGHFTMNNANDQLNIGGADLAVPGIVIDGSATASPFINLEQLSVTQSVFRYNNTLSRTELSSLDDEIALRPGNVDRLTLTAALSTLTTAVALIQDGYLVIDHTLPELRIQENDAALDQKNNSWLQQNESLTFNIDDDARANSYTWLQLQRSGTGAGVQVDTIDFTAVTDVTVNAATFDVQGNITLTGTVDGVDIATRDTDLATLETLVANEQLLHHFLLMGA